MESQVGSTQVIIVSNRLPIKVDSNGTFSVTTGGLASALASLPYGSGAGNISSSGPSASSASSTTSPRGTSSFIWVGWSGSFVEQKDQDKVRQQFRTFSSKNTRAEAKQGDGFSAATDNTLNRSDDSASELSPSMEIPGLIPSTVSGELPEILPEIHLPGNINIGSNATSSSSQSNGSFITRTSTSEDFSTTSSLISSSSSSSSSSSPSITAASPPTTSTFRYEPVFLSKVQVSDYYDGFSNATLWPILHYFTTLAQYNDKWWKNYVVVNQLFCDAVVDIVHDGDIVWVHDYHLMLLPKMLREKKPALKIGFFLHVPFPSYEIFRCIPQRKELIDGLLGSDLVGFHTFNYMRHFKSAILKCLGIECCFDTVIVPKNGKHVRLGIHPIGINWNSFQEAMNTSEYKESLTSFARDFAHRRVVLSVSRLDYTKGIPAMLGAIAHYLENYPYNNDITFLVIAVPSRDNVQTYVELREKVVKTVGEINGKYSRISCAPPIQFIYYSVNTNKLAALYSLADVCLVTPLIDGMNLVAKEFVAVQTEEYDPNEFSRHGCLILSEFTGAAQELYNSLIVNPYDVANVAETIHKALNLDIKKKIEMNTMMRKRVRENDAVYWANNFLDVLRKPVLCDSENHCQQCALIKDIPLKKSEIAMRFKGEGKKVLFLDYDSTLTPSSATTSSPRISTASSKDLFRDMFSRAFSPLLSQKKTPLLPKFIKQRLLLPSKYFINLLQKLGNRKDLDIVILSEKSSEHLDQHFGSLTLGITLISEHGYKIKKPGDSWREFARRTLDWKDKVLPYLEMYMRDTPGSYIEEKRAGLVWSYDRSEQEMGQQRAADLVGQLSEFIHNLPIEIHHNANKTVEVVSQGAGKGRVIEEILRQTEYKCALCLGDSNTDDSMFRVVSDNLVKIKVGTEETLASYKWDKIEQVLEWLHKHQSTVISS